MRPQILLNSEEDDSPLLITDETGDESTEDQSLAITTVKPSNKGCYNNGLFYANGADIETDDPCEHCYCLNGDMVCAIQVTINLRHYQKMFENFHTYLKFSIKICSLNF